VKKGRASPPRGRRQDRADERGLPELQLSGEKPEGDEAPERDRQRHPEAKEPSRQAPGDAKHDDVESRRVREEE
jgi:hypothetical protein